MSYLDDIAADVRHALPQGAEPPANSDELFVLYALLVRVRGIETTAKDVHDAWSVWMSAKDPSHESLVPYERLAPAVQAEDDPFVRAIREVASRCEGDR